MTPRSKAFVVPRYQQEDFNGSVSAIAAKLRSSLDCFTGCRPHVRGLLSTDGKPFQLSRTLLYTW